MLFITITFECSPTGVARGQLCPLTHSLVHLFRGVHICLTIAFGLQCLKMWFLLGWDNEARERHDCGRGTTAGDADADHGNGIQ